jgi:hypothetical protein
VRRLLHLLRVAPQVQLAHLPCGEGDLAPAFSPCGYWIVDPAERQIEFLVNESGRFLVALPAGREYCSQVLEEIRLDLVDFWNEVDERLLGA